MQRITEATADQVALGAFRRVRRGPLSLSELGQAYVKVSDLAAADHRLAALDALETLVLNDVLTSFDQMVEADWPHDAAVDALRSTYREWLLGRLGDAIDLGVEFLDREVAV